jgi:hypothetical protein
MKLARYLSVFVVGALLVLGLTTWLPRTSAAPATATPSAPVTSAAGETCEAGRAVHVSGTAVINVTPDRALVQLGAISTDLTPAGVQKSNTAAIQRVVDAVRALGVPDKSIATDRYIIFPVYENYDDMVPKGYRIDNVVAVTLEDVGKTSELIAVALEAGANQVQDVQFYTSELRRYRDQARDLAMKAAREKAEALATAGGAQVGCLMDINENSWSSYYGSGWGGRDRAAWTQNVVQNAPADQVPSDETPISVGQIAVRAEISASFSLR